jgi:transposase
MGLTREEKIAKARTLRKKGLKYREIGARLGISTKLAWEWVNPEKVQATNRRRRRAKREWERHWLASDASRAICARCGKKMGRGSARPHLQERNARAVESQQRTCSGCAEDRRELTIALYREGLPLKVIADRLDTTINSLGVDLVRLRKQGYDLPYRYTMKDGKRVAA